MIIIILLKIAKAFDWILKIFIGSARLQQLQNSGDDIINSKLMASGPLNLAIYQLHYELVKFRVQSFLIKKTKIKVVFLVTDCSLWCVQSVYDAFKNDIQYEPIVVVLYNHIKDEKIAEKTSNYGNYKYETMNKNYMFFKSKEMNVIYGYDIKTDKFIELKELNPLIVFYEQPYQGVLPTNYTVSEVSSYALTCYVPYGFKIANSYNSHFRHPIMAKFWRIFAESEFHGELFRKNSDIEGKNVIVTGYPKFDIYNENKNIELAKYWKIGKTGIKRIIWAPHWSIKDKSIAYSTFHNNYNFFLDLAKEYNNVEWIFKPHPELYFSCIQYNLMNKDQVYDYYKKWESMPNTNSFLEGNYFDIFKSSDALITCCGSFLAEYLPTKKPILYLINKKSIGFNVIGEKITKDYYTANKNEDIRNFIERVIIGEDDYLYEKRMQALKYVIVTAKGAGETIKEYIDSEILSK